MVNFVFKAQTFTPSNTFVLLETEWIEQNNFNLNYVNTEITTGCTSPTPPAPAPIGFNFATEQSDYDNIWAFGNLNINTSVISEYEIVTCLGRLKNYSGEYPVPLPISSLEVILGELTPTFVGKANAPAQGNFAVSLNELIPNFVADQHVSPEINLDFVFTDQTWNPANPNEFIFDFIGWNTLNHFDLDNRTQHIDKTCTSPYVPQVAFKSWQFPSDQQDYNHVWEFKGFSLNTSYMEAYDVGIACNSALDLYTETPPEINPKCTIDAVLGELDCNITGNIDENTKGTLNVALGELFADIPALNLDPMQGNEVSVLGNLVPNIHGHIQNSGEFGAILDGVSLISQGFNANTGSINSTLDVTMEFLAKFELKQGSLNVTLGELVPTITASNDPFGTMFSPLEGLTANISGVGECTGELSIILEGLTSQIVGVNPVVGSLNSSLGELSSQIGGNHFENQMGLHSVLEGFSSRQFIGVQTNPHNIDSFNDSHCVLTESAEALVIKRKLAESNASALQITECLHKEPAQPLQIVTCSLNENAELIRVRSCVTSEVAEPLAVVTCSLNEVAEPFNAEVNCIIKEPAEPLTITTCSLNESAQPLNDDVVCLLAEKAEQVTKDTCYSRLPQTILTKQFCNPNELAEPLPDGRSIWIDPEPPEPPDPDPPAGGGTTTIPEEEVYIVSTESSVTLPNGTPLGVSNVNTELDADSNAWTFSGTLMETTSRNLVTPHEDGSAQLIYVTINGYVWHFLVEKITTKRTFNSNAISFSGRGLSALLSYPYVERTSMTFGSILSNQQIAEAFLPSTGWTLNWALPVWNVPANTYSTNNKSPLQAISDLVKECGGMLVPHRNLQEMTAMPRYPVVPWFFNAVAPDISVPESVILGLTEEPKSKFGTNGVHVQGSGDSGRQALVRLSGTAGDRLANTASNALMVDSDAVRSLGKRVLSAGQPQPLISKIDTWMTTAAGDIPLFEMGHLAEIFLNGTGVKGIISSISISNTLVNNVNEVSQSIGISENTDNLINLFDKIRPAEPLLIGTVSSVVGSTSIMSMVGGGSLNVIGVGIVGQKYYVKGKELRYQAPNFAQLTDVVV